MQGERGGSGLRALYSVSIPVAQPDNVAVQNCRVPWGIDGSTSDMAPCSSYYWSLSSQLMLVAITDLQEDFHTCIDVLAYQGAVQKVFQYVLVSVE